MSEEFLRTVILPRLDQLTAELAALRDVTWPVCQGIKENGNPLNDVSEKRRFLSLMYKDDAIELLKRKASFTNVTDPVLRDEEYERICTVKDVTPKEGSGDDH